MSTSLAVGEPNPVSLVAIALQEELIDESGRFLTLELPGNELLADRVVRCGIIPSVAPLCESSERLQIFSPNSV